MRRWELYLILVPYLETEGQKEGYLVVFHARPRAYGKLSDEQLEFTIKHKRHIIHVYLVRLAALFQAVGSRE